MTPLLPQTQYYPTIVCPFEANIGSLSKKRKPYIKSNNLFCHLLTNMLLLFAIP